MQQANARKTLEESGSLLSMLAHFDSSHNAKHGALDILLRSDDPPNYPLQYPLKNYNANLNEELTQ
jgi:hypothetical protein